MEHKIQNSFLEARLAETVQLTRFDECHEVFRSRIFAKVLDDEEEPFLGGAIAKIDPPDHTVRRKVLNRLTKRDGHRWFRDQGLTPTIPRVLADEFANPDADGVVRTNLVVLSRRINAELAAAIIGLQGVDTRARADKLIELVQGLFGAIQHYFAREDRSEIVPRGLRAKQEFNDDFYAPSVLEHKRVVASYQSGQINEADLPQNLIMLQTQLADPRWADPELALRDAINLLVGIIESSTQTFTFAFSELEDWFLTHPEDRRFSTEPEFLLRAAQESMRLHPNPASFRRALEDVILVGGTAVKAGQMVALRAVIANRDTSVFGPDADRFNPRREVPPATNGYGLSFGSGPHLCLGLPLVLGADGIDGTLVHMLRALYAAGARRDAHQPVIKKLNFDRDTFEAYPVVWITIDKAQASI